MTQSLTGIHQEDAAPHALSPNDPIGVMLSVASSAHTTPAPRRWIVDSLIPVGATTGLFGDGGVGKTIMALQMGVAVGQGAPIFGFATTRAPVLGFFCEDGQAELESRLHAICRASGLAQDRIERFYYQSRFGLESLLGAFDKNGAFVVSPLFAAIQAKAIVTGARLIILDNILHLYPGNINDPGEVTRFLAALNRLALDIDGAVLVGHVAKQQGSEFSGTMAWSNATCSRLFLGRPGGLEDLTTGRENECVGRDPDERIFARLKANYAPVSDPMRLRYFEGALVRPDDIPAGQRYSVAQTVEALAEDERFLECLDLLTNQRRAVSHSRQAGNYAPRQMARMPQAQGLKKAGFDRAMERLLAQGKIVGDAELWPKPNRHTAIGIARVKVAPWSGPLRQGQAQTSENVAPSDCVKAQDIAPRLDPLSGGDLRYGAPRSVEGFTPLPDGGLQAPRPVGAGTPRHPRRMKTVAKIPMSATDKARSEFRRWCRDVQNLGEQLDRGGDVGSADIDWIPFPNAASDLRCGAKTRSGTPCRRRDLNGNGRCKLHGGRSTGPVTDAGRVRAQANLKLRWRIRTP